MKNAHMTTIYPKLRNCCGCRKSQDNELNELEQADEYEEADENGECKCDEDENKDKRKLKTFKNLFGDNPFI